MVNRRMYRCDLNNIISKEMQGISVESGTGGITLAEPHAFRCAIRVAHAVLTTRERENDRQVQEKTLILPKE